MARDGSPYAAINQARGIYTKAADGTMNVTKVRFGKKSGGGSSD